MANSNVRQIALSRSNRTFVDRNEFIHMYYNDIRSASVLSFDETAALFDKYHNGTAQEKEDARMQIFIHNAKLVVSFARQYWTMHDNLLDLIQEGNIGLLNAIEMYDVNKDCTFQKYALFHIRKMVNMYKLTTGPAIRQTNISKTCTITNRISNKFYQENYRYPTEEELMELYNEANPTTVIQNKNDIMPIEYVFIDNMVSSNGDIYDYHDYSDFVNDTSSFNQYVNDDMEREAERSQVKQLMGCLNEKEKNIVNLVFGLNGEIETSVDVVADILKCSSTRIRQVLRKSIAKMQKSSHMAESI